MSRHTITAEIISLTRDLGQPLFTGIRRVINLNIYCFDDFVHSSATIQPQMPIPVFDDKRNDSSDYRGSIAPERCYVCENNHILVKFHLGHSLARISENPYTFDMRVFTVHQKKTRFRVVETSKFNEGIKSCLFH